MLVLKLLFKKSLLSLLCLKSFRLLISHLTENKSQCLYYSLGGLNTILCCDFSYCPSLAHSKLTSFLAVPPLLQGKFSSGPFCLLFPLHEELFPHLTNSPPFRSLLKYHLRESLSEDLIATPPTPNLVFAFPALLFSISSYHH